MSNDKTKDAFASLMRAIRSASQVAGQDIQFYNSLDTDLADSSEQCGQRLLDLTNRLIQSVVQDKTEVPEINDTEKLNDSWKSVGSVLDTLFEKTDIALDDRSKHDHKIQVKEQDMQNLGGSSSSDKVVKHSKHTEKPQEKFDRKVDNSADHPFQPLLSSKPNSILSLEECNALVQDESNPDNEDEALDLSRPHYKQPYEYEIMNQPYPKMKVKEPVMYKDWESTTHTMVDTKDKLKSMLKKLKKSKEIAVDLEHHDYRSFYGFVCLMQISNRNEDWIVDTLKLRTELECLNQVFTDPKIVKVFHGASMDIIWLQRDFGLYIVSLFDTFFASKALNLKRNGLAYLLETYVKFQTSKKYQLADWRIRPMSEEMLLYARSDTHFLLYIYDVLRNELVENDKLDWVLEESRKVAAKRYEIPGYSSNFDKSFQNILDKFSMNQTQQHLLRVLYDWRDRTARVNDESPRFVMPNHFIAALCYTQPTSVNAVLGVSNGVTSLIRNNARELANLIEVAKKQAAKLEPEEVAPVVDETEVKVENNYEAYEREYKKAVKQQQRLFSTLKQPASSNASDSETEEKSRKQEIGVMRLQMPLPPIQAEPNSSDDNEEEQEEEEQVQAEPMQVEYKPVVEKETAKGKKRKLKMVDKEAKIVTRDEEQMDAEPVVVEGEKTGEEEEVPFNAFEYSATPSVYYNKGKTEPKRKRKESFNPNKYADDGPQGAKRRRGPQGGRTITYKKKSNK